MNCLKTMLVFISLACLFACNNQSNKKGNFKFDGNAEKEDIEVTKSFIYLFPSPGDILDRFYDANLTFDHNILHDPLAVENFVGIRDEALNLGIYLTDMAYSALFSQSSEASGYFDVTRKLSDDLGVSTAAFESLIDRAKNNINLSDSLISISNEVFYTMIDFLENSGKESTIAIISCGAYIESIYIAMNSIETYEPENPIVQQISELRYPMENLMNHAESNSDDPNVQSILKYIEELNDVFNSLEAESSKVTKSEPGVISFSGGIVPELNEQNYGKMKQLVKNIRNHIIGK